LVDLGEVGDAVRGASTYLGYMAERWARAYVRCDEESETLLRYVRPLALSAEQAGQRRAEHAARALLNYYSDPGAFWNLVHVGREHDIRVPGSGMDLPYLRMTVPAIGTHLDVALRAGSAYKILFRDLVMSTVGCGVAYGLGLKDSLYAALGRPQQNTRLFLCSPLTTVPVADDGKLRPLDKSTFPAVDERSAALTQLRVAILEKVRGSA
jgi:hypothetical protein